jgi:hypothetical protein
MCRRERERERERKENSKLNFILEKVISLQKT